MRGCRQLDCLPSSPSRALCRPIVHICRPEPIGGCGATSGCRPAASEPTSTARPTEARSAEPAVAEVSWSKSRQPATEGGREGSGERNVSPGCQRNVTGSCRRGTGDGVRGTAGGQPQSGGAHTRCEQPDESQGESLNEDPERIPGRTLTRPTTRPDYDTLAGRRLRPRPPPAPPKPGRRRPSQPTPQPPSHTVDGMANRMTPFPLRGPYMTSP